MKKLMVLCMLLLLFLAGCVPSKQTITVTATVTDKYTKILLDNTEVRCIEYVYVINEITYTNELMVSMLDWFSYSIDDTFKIEVEIDADIVVIEATTTTTTTIDSA
jgi:hypothetical protein